MIMQNFCVWGDGVNVLFSLLPSKQSANSWTLLYVKQTHDCRLEEEKHQNLGAALRPVLWVPFYLSPPTLGPGEAATRTGQEAQGGAKKSPFKKKKCLLALARAPGKGNLLLGTNCSIPAKPHPIKS